MDDDIEMGAMKSNGGAAKNNRVADGSDRISTVSLNVDEQYERRGNAVMSFHDIDYKVNIKKDVCGLCRGSDEKMILTGVSGVMKSGLNAIMGPTGSGKSSLLDILAGRKDPAGLSGHVLIDGNPLPSNFKRISGYVVQHDIILGTLTVRENLWFSANLRLPKSISKEMKMKRIDEILYDLGLTKCADTKIGTEMIRGVSGGEKKRATIGMELITAPTVLFLDEPTTGLDASTANAVMVLLKRLGNKGRTIILSIHQPRYSIFRLFDSLTLLSLGKVTYHGPNIQALPYFETLGYKCEEHNNPSDFFLDIINGDSTALSHAFENGQPEEWEDMLVAGNGAIEEVSKEKTTSLAQQLNDKYVESQQYKDTKDELSAILKQYQGHGNSGKVDTISTYATSFFHQLKTLSERAFRNVIRNPLASIGNLVLNLIVGVVFGLLFYQLDSSPTTGTQNRFGVLFFITTNLLFGSISAIEVFVKERDIFIHEYVSGYYRVAAYFLAAVFADLLPLRTISPLIFSAVTYWMVGLKADASSFFIFCLFVILTGYAAVSIALFYSATFNNFGVASIFISLTFVFSILFAGLLLNIESVLPWLAWIKYLSVAQYGFSGLSINEFRNQVFLQCTDRNSSSMSSLFQDASSSSLSVSVVDGNICYSITGEDFLFTRLGIGQNGVLTDWDLWQNVVALSCITLGMFFLTYIQLVRTKKYT